MASRKARPRRMRILFKQLCEAFLVLGILIAPAQAFPESSRRCPITLFPQNFKKQLQKWGMTPAFFRDILHNNPSMTMQNFCWQKVIAIPVRVYSVCAFPYPKSTFVPAPLTHSEDDTGETPDDIYNVIQEETANEAADSPEPAISEQEPGDVTETGDDPERSEPEAEAGQEPDNETDTEAEAGQEPDTQAGNNESVEPEPEEQTADEPETAADVEPPPENNTLPPHYQPLGQPPMANTMPMANPFLYQPPVTAGYNRVPGIASSPYTTPFAAPYAPLPPFYQPSMQLPLPQANAQGGYGPGGYTRPYAAARGYVQPYAPPLAQGGYGVNGGYAQAPIRNGFAPPYFPPRAAVPLPVPIFRAPFQTPFQTPFQAPLAVPQAFAGQQGAKAYAVAPPVVPVPPAVTRSKSINRRQPAFVSTRKPANILLPPTQRLVRKLPLNRVKSAPLVEPVLSPGQILKTNAGSNPALAATPVAKTPVPVTRPPLPAVVNLKTKWKNLGDAVKDIVKEVKTTLGLPEKTVPMAVPDLPPVYKPWNRQLVPTSGSFFLPETAGKNDEPLAREIRTYLKKKPPAKDPEEIIEEDASIVDPKER